MGLSLEQKQAMVSEVSAKLKGAQAVIVAEYRGLDVGRVTQLRSKARKSGLYLRVLKNTLARRAIQGTPLGGMPALDPMILVRTVATARILMPSSRIRLSAGRRSLSRPVVALCFMAGANSIFVGEKLLTAANPPRDQDDVLLDELDLRPSHHA